MGRDRKRTQISPAALIDLKSIMCLNLVSMTHRAISAGVLQSWWSHSCRKGQRIETRLSVVPRSFRLGVGLRAAYHITGTKKPYVPRGTKRIGYEQKRREVSVISLFV